MVPFQLTYAFSGRDTLCVYTAENYDFEPQQSPKSEKGKSSSNQSTSMILGSKREFPVCNLMIPGVRLGYT